MAKVNTPKNFTDTKLFEAGLSLKHLQLLKCWFIALKPKLAFSFFLFVYVINVVISHSLQHKWQTISKQVLRTFGFKVYLFFLFPFFPKKIMSLSDLALLVSLQTSEKDLKACVNLLKCQICKCGVESVSSSHLLLLKINPGMMCADSPNSFLDA